MTLIYLGWATKWNENTGVQVTVYRFMQKSLGDGWVDKGFELYGDDSLKKMCANFKVNQVVNLTLAA